MENLGTKRDVGWFWPINARKAHYYDAEGRSLCRRWAVICAPSVYRNDHKPGHGPDDCKACSRAADKRLGFVESNAGGGGK